MSALLIIIGLVIIAGLSWWRLWWGTIALIVLAPLYLVRFTFITIPTTFLEAGIYIVAAVWLVDVVRRQISLAPLRVFWRWFLPLWLVIGLVAVAQSPDHTEAFGIWKAYFFDAVLFFAVFRTVITDRAKLYRALWIAGSTVLVLALVALWQSLGLLASPEPWISQSPPRVSSVFEYPNALALFVVPIVGLLLPAAFGVGGWPARQRRFAIAVVLAGTLATALSVSQGAWFGLAAAVLVSILFVPRRRALLLGLTALVLAVFLFVPAIRLTIFDLVTFNDTSGDVRLRLWQGTIALLQHHPIVGAGLTGFPSLYDQYRDAAHVELLLYPHNIFLNFWTTLGLAGLVAFAGLLVRTLHRVMLTRSVREMSAVRLGILTAFVGMVVHGLVDVPYFKNDLAIIFWLLIAVADIVVAHAVNENKNS